MDVDLRRGDDRYKERLPEVSRVEPGRKLRAVVAVLVASTETKQTGAWHKRLYNVY